MNRPLKFGESLWALVSMALLTTQCGGGSGSRGGPTLSTPCVLAGHQYAFLVTGAGNTNVEATGVMVGSITVAADGSLQGEFDINGGGQNSQPISSGQCSDGTTQNTGTLTLVTPGIPRQARDGDLTVAATGYARRPAHWPNAPGSYQSHSL